MALGVELGERPFAKNTLQLVRAQVMLKEKMRAEFQRRLEYARQSGYFTKHKLKAVLDTTCILGRSAVKGTYNLLADDMRQLLTYMEPEIASFVLLTNLAANVTAKATSIPVWKAGQLLVEGYTLSVDETIQPPVAAKLEVGLFDTQDSRFTKGIDDTNQQSDAPLAEVRIVVDDDEIPAGPTYEMDADFAGLISFVGYNLLSAPPIVVLH